MLNFQNVLPMFEGEKNLNMIFKQLRIDLKSETQELETVVLKERL